MSRPKAYDPVDDAKYQILCRNQSYDREYEHCDYAEDRAELRHLLDNYRMAYGAGWEFKTILLPSKYWPKRIISPANVPMRDVLAPITVEPVP